jgi:uncharacterized protein (TIGR02246 family)
MESFSLKKAIAILIDHLSILAPVLVLISLLSPEASLAEEKSSTFRESSPDRNIWDYDSNSEQTASGNPEVKVLAALLSEMDDRWNAHDLRGYLEVFWQSPRLLTVSDATVLNGFQELKNTYERSFTDLESMGTIHANRIQIRMIRSDLAIAVSHWTFFFPKSNHEIIGIDTTYIKYFDFGWRVISAHSTTADR